MMETPLPTILPSGVVPDQVLTYIATLDEMLTKKIEARLRTMEPLDKEIEEIVATRQNALKYAIEHEIREDDKYRLQEIIVPPKQKVDVRILEEKYPGVLYSLREAKAKEHDAKAADIREGKTPIEPSQKETEIELKKINVKVATVLYRPGTSKVDYQVVKR